MSDVTETSQTVAAGQLRAFIERILRLKEAEDDIRKDIKDVYAEAKGTGFDKTAMGQLVTYLRKREKDGSKLDEQSAMFDLYLEAYEQPSHAHAREGRRQTADGGANINMRHSGIATDLPPHDAETGVVFEDEPETATNPVANTGEGANGAIVVASADPASRDVDGADRQQPASSGFTGEDDGRDASVITNSDVPVHVGDERTEQPEDGLSASGDHSEIEHSAPSSQVAASAGELSTPTSPAVFSSTRHQTLTGDGGHLSEPSSDAGAGARAATAGSIVNAKSEHAANSSDDSTPFIFGTVKKTAADYRPHCQNPEVCAASGLQHCYSCKKAMAESEAA